MEILLSTYFTIGILLMRVFCTTAVNIVVPKKKISLCLSSGTLPLLSSLANRLKHSEKNAYRLHKIVRKKRVCV